ncbi:MAG TPA: beta-ketoacyl synthase N-terminal-like domain-containing protein [Gammaproteobacteria bacterium]|nr:beta-ketoacyl synthase N-terminal-like domain-containing protein [Gammaproteobacteria bacterium]
MPGVYVRGMGLSCALGNDVESSVAALSGSVAAPAEVRLEQGAERVCVPFYRMPDHAELTDPARFARILSQVVCAAVAQAGLTYVEVSRLPVFVGSSCFSIGLSELEFETELNYAPEQAIPMPMCGYQDIANMARHAVGCDGETFTYNTACTSSANALLGAARMLQLGWYRHALVIGAELFNRTTLCGFAGLQLVADKLRPFDAGRNGIVLGEGVGAILLSSQPDGAAGLRLVGGASNCDTSSVTTANPDGGTVAAVLHTALRNAGMEPAAIQGIKAHGTATPSGDTAEARGLQKVFPKLPPVTVLKPYLGHTLGACGVIELILFGSALRRRFLPATPGFEIVDPDLGVHPLTRPEPARAGTYLLNYFGFGGNNTVLVLEHGAS